MKPKKRIEPVYKRFGRAISDIRIGIDMTQLQLAKKVGLSRPSIVNIENGHQRILLAYVNKFAKALNVNPRGLMDDVW